MNLKKCLKCRIFKPISEFHKDKSRKDGLNNNCKLCRKSITKKYRKKYRIQIKKRLYKWYQENKNYVNQYFRNKYNTDIDYKIGKNLRTRINLALFKNKKSKSTIKLLGCTISEFKRYLEYQFTEGMTWNNYGEWHIDHIRPCASFDLSKEEDQRACFHYTNLQPLWAKDNLVKGSKIN